MKTTLKISVLLGVTILSIASLCHGQHPSQLICPQALAEGPTQQQSGSANARHQLAFGNGCFVAVNPDGNLRSSTDGVEWRAVPVPASAFVRAVAFGKNQFVAVGGSYVGRSSIILTSSNGWSWRIAHCPTRQVLRAVAYGDGRFVAVGDAGVILSSRDGNRWQQEISGTEATLAAVAFGNGLFVAGGEDGLLLTSNNRASWTPRNSGTRLYIGRIIFQEESFHARSNIIRLSSNDGFIWSPSSTRETMPVTDPSSLTAPPNDGLRGSSSNAIPARAEFAEFESAK